MYKVLMSIVAEKLRSVTEREATFRLQVDAIYKWRRVSRGVTRCTGHGDLIITSFVLTVYGNMPQG